ncbi:MAG: ABC transporter ATP-binding protein [Acidobacteriota bacterium]
MSDEEVIRLENVEVRRGSFRLRVPSWSVPSGCVVGVIGASGAGKTTLLRLLPGLDPVHGGSVRVFGLDPRRAPEDVRSALGYMTDDLPVFSMQLDELFRFVSGYYPSWDATLVDELLQRFPLELDKQASELSKGEATKLRLILAMAFRPRVLVLDEPATGLDLMSRRNLLTTVLEVVKEPERTVIVSSHAIVDLERIADHLLVLREGEVVQQGATDELVGEGRSLEEAFLEWSGERT